MGSHNSLNPDTRGDPGPPLEREPAHLDGSAPLRQIRVPLIGARGSRYQVGYEHGRQAADLVRGTLGWSFDQLAERGIDRATGLRLAGVLLEVVRGSTPSLVEEVQGIADGARMTLLEAALINARFELLFLEGNSAPTPTQPRGECTIFGIAGGRTIDGDAIIGQNVDLGPESRPYWIMLDVTPDGGPRLLTATMAGMLAQEGINDAGLALCGSMVRCAGWRTGYPTRKFLRRLVLEQPSVAKAVELIRSAPRRASSHNLMLADAAGRLVDVETTVDEVRVIEPEAGVIAHSNHYLSPDFVRENGCIGDYRFNTAARFERMAELLRTAEGPLTVERLAGFLRDHSGGNRSICRHGEIDEAGSETNVAVISEPAKGRIHVAFGPPCETAFTTYEIPISR